MRKTVSIQVAPNPEDNVFKGAKVRKRKWVAVKKTVKDSHTKMAQEFHRFLFDNTTAEFYGELKRLMNE